MVARFADPTAAFPYPPCPLYETTGLHCPFCGAGRGLHALLHGDVLQAVAFNALFTLFIFIALAQLGWRAGWSVVSDAPLPPWRWPRWAVVATVTVTILYGLARNIPALALLAPHSL